MVFWLGVAPQVTVVTSTTAQSGVAGHVSGAHAAWVESSVALAADMAKVGNMGAAMGILGTIRDIGEAGGPIVAGFIIARATPLP